MDKWKSDLSVGSLPDEYEVLTQNFDVPLEKIKAIINAEVNGTLIKNKVNGDYYFCCNIHFTKSDEKDKLN